MTIFRSKTLQRTAVATVLLSSLTAARAVERATWELSEGAGLYELNYGLPETDDVGVYMRCAKGSGWVFMIHHHGPKRVRGAVTLEAGTAKIVPSFRVDHDGEISVGFYVDMAIPADHAVLKALAGGHPLRFNRQAEYPVRSAAERQSIRNFLNICDTQKPPTQ